MKSVKLKAGTYIVAVSGGVDSMVLLDILRRQDHLRLIVAHINHGIRQDANEDERLVRQVCMSHNIPFRLKKLYLGPEVSEETSRKARYDFLQQCRIDQNALGIVTAHHQDDLIETAIINLIRGTGWRGLAPFSQPYVQRPLLEIPKKDLINYAQHKALIWHEDSTNNDDTLLRNYVRHNIIPMFDRSAFKLRSNFLRRIRIQSILRRTIEEQLQMWLGANTVSQNNRLQVERYQLIMVSPFMACELLQAMITHKLGHSLPRPLVEKAAMFAKIGLPHKTMPLNNKWQLRLTTHQLIVEARPTVVSYNTDSIEGNRENRETE